MSRLTTITRELVSNIYFQDEWQTCQQNWVYLEVIFSAPDIQRQLPSEAKMFIVVDKKWKEIMRRTAKVPTASLKDCL